MSDVVNCVFVPPEFDVSEIKAVGYTYKDMPKEFPGLKIQIGTLECQLEDASEIESCVVWQASHICCESNAVAMEIFPEDEESLTFDLTDLVFLGPLIASSLPRNIFVIESASGVYGRACDDEDWGVSFSLEAAQMLNRDDILAVCTELDELNAIMAGLDEKREQLKEDGVDLERFSILKSRYDEQTRKKRLAGKELMHQNAKIQDVMTQAQGRRARDAAIAALHKCAARGQEETPKMLEVSVKKHIGLKRLRLAALEELKVIFPFDRQAGTLCGVRYWQSPTSAQWGEATAFLGFTTHYMYSMSRVLGSALPFDLKPLASHSSAMCYATGQTYQLSSDKSQSEKIISVFEGILLSCAHCMQSFLVMPAPVTQLSLLDELEILIGISDVDVHHLIPSDVRSFMNSSASCAHPRE